MLASCKFLYEELSGQDDQKRSKWRISRPYINNVILSTDENGKNGQKNEIENIRKS